MFLRCPSVRPCARASVRSINTIFHKSLREFHRIYNFGALGDKDELIRF